MYLGFVWFTGEGHMEVSDCTRHLGLLHLILVDVVHVASPTAKVEGHGTPGLLLGCQHLGYVICVVCIGERTSHRHSPTDSKLTNVRMSLEEAQLGCNGGGHSPPPWLVFLHGWDLKLGLGTWESYTAG